MEAQNLIDKLEQLVKQEGREAQIQLDSCIDQIRLQATAYQSSYQYWLGYSLLSHARTVIAPRADLDRILALNLGGKAEVVVEWADRLQIPVPEDTLAFLVADLHEAIEVDPTLPDLYWDLAVIQARYYADYATAADYLQEALQRDYQHPMMTRLYALIQAKPPLRQVPDTDDTLLRQLLLRLAVQTMGPLEPQLHDEEESLDFPSALPLSENESQRQIDEPTVPTNLRTFGDYVRQATKIAQNGQLEQDQYLRMLEDARAIRSDASEYVADLLRRVAESVQGQRFLDRATTNHLDMLRAGAFQLFTNRQQGEIWIRRSRRMAERGLKIVETSPATIDPDLHADLLLARGQALYYEDDEGESYVAEAIRSVQRAYRLKQQAGNRVDAERIKKEMLWPQIDSRVGKALVSLHFTEIGQSLEILKVCAEAADELNEPARTMRIKIHLASVMRQVGQFYDAESILQDIIANSTSEGTIQDAKYELASIFSETARPKDAAKIQKELLDQGEMDNQTRAGLLSNYANSLRLCSDVAGARAALEEAWSLLPPEQKQKLGNTVPQQGARVKMLLAELHLEEEDYTDALNYIKDAEELWELPLGIDALHFYSIATRCFIAVGQQEEAAAYLDKANNRLTFLLGRGPSLPSWESMLQYWSRLDGISVRVLLDSDSNADHEKALLRAESAKGRILAWLEHWYAPKGAERALSIDRQVDALNEARRWLQERPKRRILSLFGSDEGLGLFDINENGQVSADWLDEFDYSQFRIKVYEPWETYIDQFAAEGTPDSLTHAGELTEDLLNEIGSWLGQAFPNLAQGGTDLVLIPHRLFRSIPLMHVCLPGGKRLSDLFETVAIVPSLSEFERQRDASAGNLSQVDTIALADADYTLPFAQCEAILSGTNENLFVGNAVTTDAVVNAFTRHGNLVMSLHGDFDEENPLHSEIYTADGSLPLHQLILGQTPVRNHVVFLSICEAGRARRSLSDEPISFPTLLLQGGVEIVVAPAWQVDDFASFLFMSKLFEELNLGIELCHALSDTAHWLRNVDAQAVLKRTDYLMNKIMDSGGLDKRAADVLTPRLDAQKAWLETLDPTEKPFCSPLDWAAFQITGLPQVLSSDSSKDWSCTG